MRTLKIMIVDDSETIRRCGDVMLRQCGHEVVLAHDGIDAMSKVIAEQPDLIFIDVMMPNVDGFQVCGLIKNNRKFAHIPVVMLSSKDGIFDSARGKLAGASQYLVKPFNKKMLSDVIDVFCSR